MRRILLFLHCILSISLISAGCNTNAPVKIPQEPVPVKHLKAGEERMCDNYGNSVSDLSRLRGLLAQSKSKNEKRKKNMSDQTKKIEPTVHGQEEWTRWEPAANLTPRYYIHSISDNYDEGFKVVLSEEDNLQNKVHVIFKNSVACYPLTNSRYIYDLYVHLDEKYEKGVYARWTFFKVTNSEYLKRLSVESGLLSDYMNFTHFVIFGGESMLDIIADYEPEVIFFPNEVKN